MAEEFKKRNTAYKISIGLILAAMEGVELDESQRFKFLDIKGKDVYRINLIANVIDKFESNQKPYVNMTLDDGTGDIRVKAFADDVHLLQASQLGDTLLVIGVLRYYNEEIYIMPEIVRSVEPKWLVARKLELEKEYGNMYNESVTSYDAQSGETSENVGVQGSSLNVINPPKYSTIPSTERNKADDNMNFTEEEKIDLSNGNKETAPLIKSMRDVLLDMIRNAESDGGMDIDKIIMAMKEPVDHINKEITVLLEEGSIYEPKPGKLRIL
ncbi:MAG: OB-fold nucleic acid binding domain-containing protein [Candidatus Pacearchaeota archaeon]|nr:OB-fold nucleic acid binding domain-containing protein [Candidatus Pacearchaeota archaeon]